MKFPEFLDWLARQDVQRINSEELLDNVTVVLENLQENDPRYAWMAVIEDRLLDGEIPTDRLLGLPDRFPGDRSLEGRLRQRARQAPAKQLETESILRLRRALESWEEDPTPLHGYLQWMELQLKQFWQEHQPSPAELSGDELDKVAARLLLEAFENWKTALKNVSQGDFEGGLGLAIQANRLLVALHDLDERPI
ncbi:hypothetical protein JST97_08635 [bacterium]|nr:hypothetical protein [bacterium]